MAGVTRNLKVQGQAAGWTRTALSEPGAVEAVGAAALSMAHGVFRPTNINFFSLLPLDASSENKFFQPHGKAARVTQHLHVCVQTDPFVSCHMRLISL